MKKIFTIDIYNIVSTILYILQHPAVRFFHGDFSLDLYFFSKVENESLEESVDVTKVYISTVDHCGLVLLELWILLERGELDVGSIFATDGVSVEFVVVGFFGSGPGSGFRSGLHYSYPA